MRAITVVPGVAGSVRLENWPEPLPEEGAVLIQGHSMGICGTDWEIAQGAYGAAPEGSPKLVLGHESLGRVLEAPAGSGLASGDWVVGMVRHPDPVPCSSCAVGEWDMCRNGRYTEHGIKGVHGFGRERYRLGPDRVVKVDPALKGRGVLLEPASVVVKAWEGAERIGRRAHWEPRRVLVTGAGPIGLLAAMLGRQRGLEVWVLDRANDGPKPELVRALGATYLTELPSEGEVAWDLVFECTGAPSLLFQAVLAAAPVGVVCLTGVSTPGRTVKVDAGGLNRELVLENNVVFGSVNANRRHYEAAGEALAKADPDWLDRVLTRRLPLQSFRDGFIKQPGEVKTVVLLGADD